MLEANVNPEEQGPDLHAQNEDILEEATFAGLPKDTLQTKGVDMLDALAVNEFREQFIKQHSEMDFPAYLALVQDSAPQQLHIIVHHIPADLLPACRPGIRPKGQI